MKKTLIVLAATAALATVALGSTEALAWWPHPGWGGPGWGAGWSGPGWGGPGWGGPGWGGGWHPCHFTWYPFPHKVCW